MKGAASSAPQPEPSKTTWLGDPTKILPHSGTHYRTVQVAQPEGKSTVVTLGDAVEVKSDGKRPYLGLVEELWEDKAGAMNMKCRWFYYQEDVRDVDPKLLSSKPPKQGSGSEAASGKVVRPRHPQEIFFSNVRDTNDVELVLRKAFVVGGNPSDAPPRETELPRHTFFVCEMFLPQKSSFQPLPGNILGRALARGRSKLAKAGIEIGGTAAAAAVEPLPAKKKPAAAETAAGAAAPAAASHGAPDSKKRKRPLPQHDGVQGAAKASPSEDKGRGSGGAGSSSGGGSSGSRGGSGAAAAGGGRGVNGKGKAAVARTASGSDSDAAETPAASAGGGGGSSKGGSSGGGNSKRRRQANGSDGGGSSGGGSKARAGSEAAAKAGAAAGRPKADDAPIPRKQRQPTASKTSSFSQDEPSVAAAAEAATAAAAAAAAGAAAAKSAAREAANTATASAGAAGLAAGAAEPSPLALPQVSPYLASSGSGVGIGVPSFCLSPNGSMGMLRRPSIALSTHSQSADDLSMMGGQQLQQPRAEIRIGDEFQATVPPAPTCGPHAVGAPASSQLAQEGKGEAGATAAAAPAAASGSSSGGNGGFGAAAMDVDQDAAAAAAAAAAAGTEGAASGMRGAESKEQRGVENKEGELEGGLEGEEGLEEGSHSHSHVSEPAVWWPGVLDPAAVEEYLFDAYAAERLTEGTAVVVTLRQEKEKEREPQQEPNGSAAAAAWPLKRIKRWAIVERDLRPAPAPAPAPPVPVPAETSAAVAGGAAAAAAVRGPEHGMVEEGRPNPAGDGGGGNGGRSGSSSGGVGAALREQQHQQHDVVLRLPAPLYDETSGGTIVRITVPRYMVSGRLTEDVALKLLAERGGNASLALAALLADPALALGSTVDQESGRQRGDAEPERWSRKQVEKLLEVLEEAGGQGPTLEALASVPGKTPNQVAAFLFRLEPGCGIEPELQTLFAPRALGWRCQRAVGQPAVGGRRLLSRMQQKELTEEMNFLRLHSQAVVHSGVGGRPASPSLVTVAIRGGNTAAAGGAVGVGLRTHEGSGSSVVHRARANGFEGSGSSSSHSTTCPKPPKPQRKKHQQAPPQPPKGGNPYLERLKAVLPKKEADSVMVALSRFHKRLIDKEELIRHMCRVLLVNQMDNEDPSHGTAVKLEPTAGRHANPAVKQGAVTSAGDSSGGGGRRRDQRRELLDGFASLLSSPEDQLLFQRCCREEEEAAAGEAAKAAALARARKRQEQQLQAQLQPQLACN